MENIKQSMPSKTISNSFFWKISERLFVQGLNLVVQIILARILFPEDFGNLAIIVAVTNYAAIFVQTGFATAIIQKKDLDDLDISTLFVTSMLFAVLLYIVLFLFSPLISSCYDTTELIWPLRVLGLLLFLNAINSIQTALYSRRMEFKKIFIRSIISVPLSGIVGIVLALQGFGLWALVIHNILNVLIIIIVMAFDKNCRLGLKFSISRFKKLLPFSGKIILTGAVTGGGDFLRTLIIGKKYNTEDLAYYDKAYTYSNYATQIVGLSITSVMLPSFSREQNNPNSLKKMARASIRLSTFIMFPVLLGFASIAKPFVLILLTKKWEASIPFLIIFCLLRMPAFISNIDKQVYYAIGKSGISLVYECVLLVLNIVSLLISVQYGVIYIALGAMIVEWVGCMIIWWISNRAYGYTLKERMTDIAKPLMNSVVMYAASYSIQLIDLKLYLSLILQIFVGIIVYCVMSSLTKDRNIKDIISFIKAKKRKTND